MKTAIARLRIICWIGALVDLFFAVALITPSLWGAMFGIQDFSPGLQHRLDMGIGASLMLGWTCLLIWVGLDPIRRRAVLALTMFPVLAGFAITACLAIVNGANSLGGLLWVFGLKVFLVGILTYGLVISRQAALESA